MKASSKVKKSQALTAMLLGGSGVGKTTLLRAISTIISNKKKKQETPEPRTTIGFYIQEVNISSKKWSIVDVGSLFQTAIPACAENVDIFVIVIDVCNKRSWEKIEEYVLSTLCNENCIIRPDAQMLLVANKIDSLPETDVSVLNIESFKENIVEKVREKNLYKNFQLPIIETSALEKTNIDILIKTLKEIYMEMMEARSRNKNKKCSKFF